MAQKFWSAVFVAGLLAAPTLAANSTGNYNATWNGLGKGSMAVFIRQSQPANTRVVAAQLNLSGYPVLYNGTPAQATLSVSAMNTTNSAETADGVVFTNVPCKLMLSTQSGWVVVPANVTFSATLTPGTGSIILQASGGSYTVNESAATSVTYTP